MDPILAAFSVEDLPTVNALLNATAAVLLVVGYVLIRQGREQAHKRAMLSAFGVSIAFLACYLVYHWQVRHVPFLGPPVVRVVYLAILISHIVLAACVPVLAIVTIWLGLADRRAAHRRLARWTLPIWLYVSVTGVIVYLMLYHLWPGAPATAMLDWSRVALQPAAILKVESCRT
ncbi:MAG: DUF420 domain-containing protein [Pirellulales bacterium]|nr:DUF420 domain-containing protein [Pirellulales bacterium]